MDSELYDEFGNYIGPDIDESDDDGADELDAGMGDSDEGEADDDAHDFQQVSLAD